MIPEKIKFSRVVVLNTAPRARSRFVKYWRAFSQSGEQLNTAAPTKAQAETEGRDALRVIRARKPALWRPVYSGGGQTIFLENPARARPVCFRSRIKQDAPAQAKAWSDAERACAKRNTGLPGGPAPSAVQCLDIPPTGWRELAETITRAQGQALVGELDRITQHAAQLSAYLGAIAWDGFAHDNAAKISGKKLVRLRKAVGFTYPEQGIPTGF